MARSGSSQIAQLIAVASRITLVAATLLAVSPAGADYHLGIRTGYLSVDSPKRSNPKNLALGLSVDIDNSVTDLRLVGEFSRSISDGETRSGNDLTFASDGIYLVTRTPHALFTIFRSGLIWNRIELDRDRESNEGVAIGIGIGVITGKASMLIEYTDLAGDARFLTFGLEF